MRSEHQQMCQAFMEKAGQAVRDTPQAPPAEELPRIVALIHEELLELARAAGVTITLTKGTDLALEHEDNHFGYAVTGTCDLIEYADALGDTDVTVKCAMLAAGIDDLPLLAEIDRSNMTRFGEGGYRRADGKWMKSPLFEKPALAQVLGLEE